MFGNLDVSVSEVGEKTLYGQGKAKAATGNAALVLAGSGRVLVLREAEQLQSVQGEPVRDEGAGVSQAVQGETAGGQKRQEA